MSEEKWLACSDPDPMLEFAGGNASERGLRLFGCACIQRALRVIPGEHYQAALDLAVRYADGEVRDEELVAAEASIPYQFADMGRYCFHFILSTTESSTFIAKASAIYSADALSAVSKKAHEDLRHAPTWRAELATQCNLLRDIFGNPFRPFVFDPAWRTDTAVSLARQMYESRDFGAMPILADALQDAGCDNTDILNHCRDASAPHVRGCWVVDLVLGKS
jgi:hypothetical protein